MTDLTKMPQYPGSAATPPVFTHGTSAATQAPSAAEDATNLGVERPVSGMRKGMSVFGWVLTALVSLTIFTCIKLPEDKVKGLIQGNISALLATKGITFSAGQTSFGILLGPSYVMKDVTLNFPPPEPPAHIDKIEVSPLLSTLLTGKLGAKLSIENGGGKVFVSGAFRGTKVSGRLEANKMDIGKIGLLSVLADLSGSAVISGKGTFSTNTAAFNETDADIQLDLSKIVINQQAISGFSIPRLGISQGKFELEVHQGRGVLKRLQLGNPSSTTDDIKANLSGDLNFGKTLSSSTMNVRANFSLSQSILKSFSLLGAILGSAKQPDGSFSYHLSGPLLAPNPTPVGPNGT
jgi:type II secretion system protein N